MEESLVSPAIVVDVEEEKRRLRKWDDVMCTLTFDGHRNILALSLVSKAEKLAVSGVREKGTKHESASRRAAWISNLELQHTH